MWGKKGPDSSHVLEVWHVDVSFLFHNTNEPAVADVLQVFLFGPELPSFVASI